MSDRYETAFRRYVIEGGKVADVARELGTSTASIIRWARKWEKQHPEQAHEARRAAAEHRPEAPRGFMAIVAARVAGESVPPPASPEDRDDDEDDEDEPGQPDELPADADALTIVRHQIGELRSFIVQARRLGNLETAQRFTRSLVELTNALRQLEKSARQDDGVIVASKTAIDDAIKTISEKVAAVAGEELVCAECGHKMRRRKAGG